MLTLYRVRYKPGTEPAERFPSWSNWAAEVYPGEAVELREAMLNEVELQTQVIEPVPATYFSRYVLGKAADGVEQVEENADPAQLSWTVTSSSGTASYRVSVLGDSGYLTCTCSHGRHAGGHARCYHVAATLALVGLLEGVSA